MLERKEIGRLIVWRSLLPTPIENTNPFERESPYSGLMGFPLVALLLVIHPCPKGMPDRLCRPFHKCLAQECRTLKAPVDPRLFTAAFGHRGNPSVLLQFNGRGIAFALLAKGDQKAGSKDGSGTWEGLEEGKVGVALGALGDSSVKMLDGVQGDTKLADKGLDEQDMGGNDTFISGQGQGGLDGVDTLVDDVRRAHMMVAEECL